LKAAGTTINLGEWIHIAGTYDGFTQKLYIDGELKGSATLGGDIIYPPSGWFQIGAYKDDNEDFRHDGCISDVIIWEGALSSQKVKNLYHKTMPPYVVFDAEKTVILAGKYVEFDDLSQFEPQSWKWYFEGGNPETSTEQNPVVHYEENGTFDVSLVVENAFGSDSLLKEKYITVGTTGTETLKSNDSSVEIYPNPAFDKLIVHSKQNTITEIKIYDAAGTLLNTNKPKWNKRNTVDISFLQEGLYYIQIKQGKHAVVKKFVKKP
ncbi:MAG: LamG-like jellyroll fold domain-containing protein, partial [Mariniphaga sp.]